jgi:predicted alpha/beta-fold hydrolase
VPLWVRFTITLQFFHGARVLDAHSAATILRNRVKRNEQVLAGVGYSLGAIVLNHCVATFGERVALDVSVAISGALDCTYQQVYRRSQRIWQPMIISHMKDQFLYPKWGNRIIHQIGQENYQKLMRAGDIVVGTIV